MRRIVLLIVIFVLAGCNLETSGSATVESPETGSRLPPTPTIYRAPTLLTTPGAFVVPTPMTAPTLIGGGVAQPQAQAVNPQPTYPPSNLPTPVPGQAVNPVPQPTPTSQTVVEAVLENLVIPVWNAISSFFTTVAASLWQSAGDRGGSFAQILCCIGPAVVLVGVILVRLRIIRIRR